MKLYYYRHPDGISNFGDDLNPWLWPQLLPGLLDEDATTLLVGIGTLLNEHLPLGPKKIVFSTGVGYGKAPPRLDKNTLPYCVRGPLSAMMLGLPPEKALADGALLLRQVRLPRSTKKNYRLSYMPHLFNAVSGGEGWKILCERLGLGYIDPRSDVEAVLTMIEQTEVLITEAMHGAIVADALRTPWIAVHTEPNILPFKWMDWALSLNLHYQPHYFIRMENPPQNASGQETSEYWHRMDHLTQEFYKLLKPAVPILSRDSMLENRTEQLLHVLMQLQQDYHPEKGEAPLFCQKM